MLFAIDHGNSAVKTTNFVFTSGLAEYPVKPPLQTDVLEWGGKFWALSGQRISFMRDKTRDDRFFIQQRPDRLQRLVRHLLMQGEDHRLCEPVAR